MNRDLKDFIGAFLVRAVLPALLLVAGSAFLFMPYTLGHHPGESAPPPQTGDWHKT